jgi:hypothetical protein
MYSKWTGTQAESLGYHVRTFQVEDFFGEVALSS